MPTAKPDLVALRKVVEEQKRLDAAGSKGEASDEVSESSLIKPRVGTKRARQEARAAACPPCTRLFVGNLPFIVDASAVNEAFLSALNDEAPPPAPGTKEAKKWRRAQRKEAEAALWGGVSANAGKKAAEWGGDVVVAIKWISDRSSGLFYGSAFVEVVSLAAASALVERAATSTNDASADTCAPTTKAAGVRLRGRKLRVYFSAAKEGEVWPPHPEDARERPPVGVQG
mmetsp:Transcript_19072/g.38877  ORF Transcript_19072/g.38877 Transcript_19072/m.38877 type:complete len:229 (-) Transcript_19072:929-1615(-)